jgi:hypothetical protein
MNTCKEPKGESIGVLGERGCTYMPRSDMDKRLNKVFNNTIENFHLSSADYNNDYKLVNKQKTSGCNRHRSLGYDNPYNTYSYNINYPS